MAGPAPEHPDTPKFGTWLAGIMRRRKLSQTELANRLELSQSIVSKWISGARVPSRENCEILAETLDVPLNEVLVFAGILPRQIHIGVSGKHTHLHDLVDELPERLVDPLITMVEAIIRETK